MNNNRRKPKYVWVAEDWIYNNKFNPPVIHITTKQSKKEKIRRIRIFWLASFLVAVGFSFYFNVMLYLKFENNPVIMSFNPISQLVEDIPFPSIYICNVNIPKKDIADEILKNGPAMEKNLLIDYCSSMNNIRFNVSAEEHNHDTDNWSVVSKFLLKVSQSCTEMITVCQWKGEFVNCLEYINSVWTDEGYCCVFNKMPYNVTMTKHAKVDSLNDSYPKGANIIDWNPDDGYPSDSSRNDWPLRTTAGPGASQGITFVLDADIDQYFCSSTSSAGFKIIMANPLDSPRVAQFGWFVSPGTETMASIRPTVIDTTEGLRSLNARKRKCYFADERRLKFFRKYSERNCLLECQANSTLRQCQCVPYYLPIAEDTAICGRSKETCVKQAQEQVENLDAGEGNACDCLPGCSELGYYPYSITHSRYITDNPASIAAEFIQNNTFDYFIRNMAILHIFFRDKVYMKQTKSELYGFAEFMSNTGGLLGFFYGFSFMTAIEILYYLFIRSTCYMYKNNKTKRLKKKNRIAFKQ